MGFLYYAPYFLLSPHWQSLTSIFLPTVCPRQPRFLFITLPKILPVSPCYPILSHFHDFRHFLQQHTTSLYKNIYYKELADVLVGAGLEVSKSIEQTIGSVRHKLRQHPQAIFFLSGSLNLALNAFQWIESRLLRLSRITFLTLSKILQILITCTKYFHSNTEINALLNNWRVSHSHVNTQS